MKTKDIMRTEGATKTRFVKIGLLTAILFSVLFVFTSKAQQLPLYSQYMMNGFLLNPAMTGSQAHSPLILTARRQWEGITDAPQTYALSGHTPISAQRMGVGGYIYADIFGPVKRVGIQAAYAYHVKLDRIDSKLGLGLSVSAFQHIVDQSELVSIDLDDDALSGSKETAFVPDVNFGLYLYSNKYFVGFSANQLLQYKLSMTESDENKMVRHYFINGGYEFALSDKFDLIPSVLFKATEKSPAQLDINLKAVYLKNYWLGISSRNGFGSEYFNSDALICMIGVKVKMFYIGYAFDYTFGSLSKYSHGSHEVMIGVNINDGAVSGSALF